MSKNYYRFSVGVIFALTGIAKVWSAFGDARILLQHDPILGLQFGNLMFVVGIFELALAGICLFGKSRMFWAILVACLSTNILAYRLGLWLMGWHRPCRCLGNLTDALHI